MEFGFSGFVFFSHGHSRDSVRAAPDAKNWNWKRHWCWERLKVGGEGDERGWGAWMASPTQWTWVWVSSGSCWWIGKPGVLRFMRSQRVGHYWATELNWCCKMIPTISLVSIDTISCVCDENLRFTLTAVLKYAISCCHHATCSSYCHRAVPLPPLSSKQNLSRTRHAHKHLALFSFFYSRAVILNLEVHKMYRDLYLDCEYCSWKRFKGLNCILRSTYDSIDSRKIFVKLSDYLCYARCPNPRVGREKASKTMQLAKREVYCWLESGLLPHPTQWCGVREPRAQAVTQIYRVSISSW